MKTVTVHLLVDSDDDTAIRGLVYDMLTPTLMDPFEGGVQCIDYHVEEPTPAATYVEQAFRDDEYEEGLFMPATTD